MLTILRTRFFSNNLASLPQGFNLSHHPIIFPDIPDHKPSLFTSTLPEMTLPRGYKFLPDARQEHMHWLDVREETGQHLLYSLQAAKHETLAMSHAFLRRGGEFIPGINYRNESIGVVFVSLSHPPHSSIVRVSVTRLSETTRTTVSAGTNTPTFLTTPISHIPAASPRSSVFDPPQPVLSSTHGSYLSHAEPREAQSRLIEIPDRQAWKGRHRMWSPRHFWYGGRQFVWQPHYSGSKIACEILYELLSSEPDPESNTGKRTYDYVKNANGKDVPLVWGEGGTKWDVRVTIYVHAGLDEGFVEYVLAVQLTRINVQAISGTEANPIMQGPVMNVEF